MKIPLNISIKIIFLSLLRKIKSIIKSRFKRKQSKGVNKKRQVVSLNEVVQTLSELGVSSGDVVIVHSGISNLGKLEKGAVGLLKSLKEIIGKEGALFLPGFRFNGTMKQFLDDNEVVDFQKNSVKMGALSIKAVNDHDFKESMHPTHTVLGYGEKSREMLSKHQYSQSPFDEKSPFYLLSESKGKIITIGVDLDKVTNFHVIEDQMLDEFPVPTYLDAEYEVLIRNLGKEYKVRTKCHNPDLSLVRNCERFHEEFIREGIMLKTPVGSSYIAVIDALKMNNFLREKAKSGYTIYGKV